MTPEQKVASACTFVTLFAYVFTCAVYFIASFGRLRKHRLPLVLLAFPTAFVLIIHLITPITVLHVLIAIPPTIGFTGAAVQTYRSTIGNLAIRYLFGTAFGSVLTILTGHLIIRTALYMAKHVNEEAAYEASPYLALYIVTLPVGLAGAGLGLLAGRDRAA